MEGILESAEQREEPMSPIIVWLTAASSVVVLSALGLYQRRWKALRLAVVLGWVGPLPGFYFEMFASRGALRSPEHMGFVVSAWEMVRGIGGAFASYLVFAVPIFGSYCFLVGLAGGAFINRYTQPPAPRWIQPPAIVAASIGAAVPVVLLFPEFRGAAAVSSLFCAGMLLIFRRRLFDA